MSLKDKPQNRKAITTTLTIKLMKEKTLRDMYTDFFKDKVDINLHDTAIFTTVKLGGMDEIPYSVYKKFSGYGANREFLESFTFDYAKKYKRVSPDVLVNGIYSVIPFVTTPEIKSVLSVYTLGSDRLNWSQDLLLQIETSSWSDKVTADDVKAINKANARKLRKYLVSLPSVQGVPYSCSFREDSVAETQCSV